MVVTKKSRGNLTKVPLGGIITCNMIIKLLKQKQLELRKNDCEFSDMLGYKCRQAWSRYKNRKIAPTPSFLYRVHLVFPDLEINTNNIQKSNNDEKTVDYITYILRHVKKIVSKFKLGSK